MFSLLDDDVTAMFDLDVQDAPELHSQLTSSLSPQSQSQREFCWNPCSYTLCSEKNELWPEIELGVLHQRPLIGVQMQRTPSATDSGTFLWHKNCVLPRLCVSVQQITGISEGAAILVSAVTVDVLTNTARSIGLVGETLRPLVNGECTFSSREKIKM